MNYTIFVAAGLAAAAGASFAAPVSVDRDLNFSTAESLFGSGGSASFDFGAGFGSGTSAFQGGASTGASTGEVSSTVNASVNAGFHTVFETRDLVDVPVTLGLNAFSASFETDLGAFADVFLTVRTPSITVPIPVLPDIQVPSLSATVRPIDLDYSLDVGASRSGLGALSGEDAVELTGVGTPDLPIEVPGLDVPSASVGLDIDQRSTLQLSELVGLLHAQEVTTGASATSAFVLADDPQRVTLADLAPGEYDLTFKSLDLVNSFSSSFGLAATFDASIPLPVIADLSLSRSLAFPGRFPLDPFELDYGGPGSVSLGRITIAAVPLPAAAPLLTGGLAALALVRRRRSAGA